MNTQLSLTTNHVPFNAVPSFDASVAAPGYFFNSMNSTGESSHRNVNYPNNDRQSHVVANALESAGLGEMASSLGFRSWRQTRVLENSTHSASYADHLPQSSTVQFTQNAQSTSTAEQSTTSRPLVKRDKSLEEDMEETQRNLERGAARRHERDTKKRQEQEMEQLLTEGIAKFQKARFSEAIPDFEKALELARQTSNRISEARAMGNLAAVYQNLGDPMRAVELSLPCLDIMRELGNREKEIRILDNLSLYYQHMRRYRDALRYLQEELRLVGDLTERQKLETRESSLLEKLGMTRSSRQRVQK